MPTTDSNPLSAIILFRYLNIGKYRKTIGEVSVKYLDLFLLFGVLLNDLAYQPKHSFIFDARIGSSNLFNFV